MQLGKTEQFQFLALLAQFPFVRFSSVGFEIVSGNNTHILHM